MFYTAIFFDIDGDLGVTFDPGDGSIVIFCVIFSPASMLIPHQIVVLQIRHATMRQFA
jgi:hypothetical protein